MKIAVSSTGKTLESAIDPRFGRCAYFMIIDTEDMSFEVFDNQNVASGVVQGFNQPSSSPQKEPSRSSPAIAGRTPCAPSQPPE